MNMNRKHYLSTAATIAAIVVAGAMASCIDKEYDIEGDDLDGTIEIAPGGITVPLATIERYEISELIKDFDQITVTDDGLLAVRVSGQATTDVPVPGAVIAAAAQFGEGAEPVDAITIPEIDLADMLDGLDVIDILEGATLDLAAPRITMSITNPTPVTIGSTMTLTPSGGDPVVIDGLDVGPAEEGTDGVNYFFIAEDGVAAPADRNYVTLHPANLRGLASDIMGTINGGMAVSVLDGNAADVDIEAMYEFGAAYDIACPLAFGSAMRFPVPVTSTQMLDMFANIAERKISVPEVGIKAEITASFPFRIADIEVEFYDNVKGGEDGDGNLIEEVDLAVDGVIEGPAPTGTGNVSTLSLTLKVADGDLRRLARVKQMRMNMLLTPTATGNELSGFRPTDYIEGRVWATLPEGATVDIKDLLDDKE
jgi:hypothetical protein